MVTSTQCYSQLENWKFKSHTPKEYLNNMNFYLNRTGFINIPHTNRHSSSCASSLLLTCLSRRPQRAQQGRYRSKELSIKWLTNRTCVNVIQRYRCMKQIVNDIRNKPQSHIFNTWFRWLIEHFDTAYIYNYSKIITGQIHTEQLRTVKVIIIKYSRNSTSSMVVCNSKCSHFLSSAFWLQQQQKKNFDVF